jgi:hypothetical protein
MNMVSFLAHFNGKYLLPEEPVNLPTDKPLRVTVEEVPTAVRPPGGSVAAIFDGIESECGLMEGPENWALELDHYLYGAPKRSDVDGK